jgi:hypothetical protein
MVELIIISLNENRERVKLRLKKDNRKHIWQLSHTNTHSLTHTRLVEKEEEDTRKRKYFMNTFNNHDVILRKLNFLCQTHTNINDGGLKSLFVLLNFRASS